MLDAKCAVNGEATDEESNYTGRGGDDDVSG
jgi:hypothetical protein